MSMLVHAVSALVALTCLFHAVCAQSPTTPLPTTLTTPTQPSTTSRSVTESPLDAFRLDLAESLGFACLPQLEDAINSDVWTCLHDTTWSTSEILSRALVQSEDDLAGVSPDAFSDENIQAFCSTACVNRIAHALETLSSSGCDIQGEEARLSHEGALMYLINTVRSRLHIWCTRPYILEESDDDTSIPYLENTEDTCYSLDEDILLISLTATSATPVADIMEQCTHLSENAGCLTTFFDFYSTDSLLRSLFGNDLSLDLVQRTCLEFGVAVEPVRVKSPYFIGLYFLGLDGMRSTFEALSLSTCQATISELISAEFYSAVFSDIFAFNPWFFGETSQDDDDGDALTAESLLDACRLPEANLVTSVLAALEAEGCAPNYAGLAQVGYYGDFVAKFARHVDYFRFICTESINDGHLCFDIEAPFERLFEDLITRTSCDIIANNGGCFGNLLLFMERQPSLAEELYDTSDPEATFERVSENCLDVGVSLSFTRTPLLEPLQLGIYTEDHTNDHMHNENQDARTLPATATLLRDSILSRIVTAAAAPSSTMASATTSDGATGDTRAGASVSACRAAAGEVVDDLLLQCLRSEEIQHSSWVEEFSLKPYFFLESDEALVEACTSSCTLRMFELAHAVESNGCEYDTSNLDEENESLFLWTVLSAFYQALPNYVVQCTFARHGAERFCGSLFQDLARFHSERKDDYLTLCASIVNHGFCLGTIRAFLEGDDPTRSELYFGVPSAADFENEIINACVGIGVDVSRANSQREDLLVLSSTSSGFGIRAPLSLVQALAVSTVAVAATWFLA